jgi:NosR/NirI family nitrous oxide reductase transcriptional regulator
MAIVVGLVLAVALQLTGITTPAQAAELSRLLHKVEVSTVFPGADRIGKPQGEPPVAPAYTDGERVGHVFLNSDFVNSVGYSGKPIHIAVGMAPDGEIRGAQLIEHHEPIVLIGIPEEEMLAFIDGYAGHNVVAEATGEAEDAGEVDIISGATVTVMVIDDSIRRAALKVARTRGLAGMEQAGDTGPARRLRMDEAKSVDWTTLTGDGSIRRLTLSVGDVTRAFEAAGKRKAAQRPREDDPNALFIDLYAGLASIPTVGKSVLGPREYEQMQRRLSDGQHAVVIGGRGPYSFKGSGYVRGGVFDRIRLIQGETTIRFRDLHHKRLREVAAPGAPDLDEVGVFRIPEGVTFDPTEPWTLELLVQRNVGGRQKDFTTIDLGYAPPPKYIETAPAPARPRVPGRLSARRRAVRRPPRPRRPAGRGRLSPGPGPSAVPARAPSRSVRAGPAAWRGPPGRSRGPRRRR